MRGTIQIAGITVGSIISAYSITLHFMGFVAMIGGMIIPPAGLYALGFIAFAGFMGWALHDARNRVKAFEDASPNIVYSQPYEIPLYKKRTNQLIFHVLEVWFKNSPIVPAESSIAKGVTASINFYEYSDSPKRILRITGVWLIAEAPDFGAPTEWKTTMNMLPNDESWKLLIALKHDNEDDAYGFAKESFTYSKVGDGKEETKKLKLGEYLVDIELRGVGVKDNFWGKLTNLGKEGTLEMGKVIKIDDKSRQKGISKKQFYKLLDKASQPTEKSEEGKS